LENVARLLDRLEGVKARGRNQWVARCPAHDDRSPSLSIRELDDGRILIHDFGGCPATDVLAAVGMELGDLFPERLDDHKPPSRDRLHRHAAVEALKTISTEALVVVVAAENLAVGVALDDADRDRLMDAATKVRAAREAVTWAS
jgi:hypothetical protein